MKRNYVLFLAMLSGVFGVLYLYNSRLENNTQLTVSTSDLIPSITPQQVEYFIDRNKPLDDFPMVTPTPTGIATVSANAKNKNIADAYELSYPYSRLFPFRTSTISAAYRLEPKRLYIRTSMGDAAALSIVETHLKKYAVTLKDLRNKGVILIFDRDMHKLDPLSRE